MLNIAPFWNHMLGSFMTELQAAVAPFFSDPLAGEIPLFTGCPALRPSGVAPMLFPKAMLPVTGLWL